MIPGGLFGAITSSLRNYHTFELVFITLEFSGGSSGDGVYPPPDLILFPVSISCNL